MRLIRARLENFRAHKDTRLGFPSGVVGIVGGNEAGKSTIIESLEYALYGSRAIRGRVSDLRWRGAPPRKPARVTWRFALGERQYKVVRTETGASLFEGDVETAAGHPGVTKSVEQLLGMTLDEFRASYLCRQKDVSRLIGMTPIERTTFVRRLLGADKVDSAVKISRAEHRSAKAQADAQASMLGDLDELVAEGKREAGLAERLAKDEKAANERVEKARSAASIAEQVKHCALERSMLTSQLAKAEKEAAFSSPAVAELEEAKALERRATEALVAFEKDFDRERRQKAEAAERRASTLLLRREAEWQQEVERAKDLLRAARNSAKRWSQALGDGRCPTCKREHANLDELQRDYEEARRRLGEAETRVVEAQAADCGREAASKALKEAASAASRARNEESSHRHLGNELRNAAAKVNRLAAKHAAEVERARSAAERVQQLRAEVAAAGDDDLPAYVEAAAAADAAQKDVEKAWGAQADVRAEGAACAGRIVQIAARITREKHRRKRAKHARAKLAHEAVVLDRLTEFRNLVVGSIHPDVSALITGMVSALTDGRHETAELDDSFGLVLHEDGVPSPVVSGGTEDVAALALRLAVSQLITQRSGQPLSLLILDEPFGSLDAVRRANVLSLLRRLEGTFPQIVLISHVSDTRQSVDHAVELEYDEQAGHTKVVA